MFCLDAAGKEKLWRDVGDLACMMPEDRNAGVRSPGALAAAPFIPKTTYRRIKRCFSFRKGRSILSLCSALLMKPWFLRSQGAVCAGADESTETKGIKQCRCQHSTNDLFTSLFICL